ncbi:hypothetical protein Phi2_0042 [Vibrio phage phi 2]|uniref:helix-turn-helix domain protein n=1 Tax=Vibrio phage X29 TaxID=1500713 RepID=UPI00045FD81C|nr:helix-turn-helix domain protein [Vibrio phage X29]AHN84851.1 hypothetical protein Phi2_0042 [Vibrio phage phi 2]AIA10307.1 helix-turn-helix domain protein [Vibrio phage X29]
MRFKLESIRSSWKMAKAISEPKPHHNKNPGKEDVLSALKSAPYGITIRDLMKKTGFVKGKVYRCINELVDHGVVIQKKRVGTSLFYFYIE